MPPRRRDPGRRVQIAKRHLAGPHGVLHAELLEEVHGLEREVLGLARPLGLAVGGHPPRLLQIGPGQLETLVDRLQYPHRIAGLLVRVGQLPFQRVDQREHAPRGALLELILEPKRAGERVIRRLQGERKVASCSESLGAPALELVHHVPFGSDQTGHLERLAVELQRVVDALHLELKLPAAEEAENLLARRSETGRDLGRGGQMRFGRREVVPEGGDRRETDPHARHARFAADLDIGVQGAVEVLRRLVPRAGLQMDDADVRAGDGDEGEIPEARRDLHRAQQVPRRLAPVREMAVEHAEVVVGTNHALFVVQIPSEEMQGRFVEFLRLVQIAETEMNPAEAIVGVRERRHEVVIFEVGVRALAAAERLLVLGELDQRATALELKARQKLGAGIREGAAPCPGQMLEGSGSVPSLDQNLGRFQLERGDPGRIEPEAFRGANALLEILQRRQVAVGSDEYLGEIFEGLEMSFGVLREARGRYRFLTLPNQVSRSLVHVSSSESSPGPVGPTVRNATRTPGRFSTQPRTARTGCGA